MGYRPLVLHNDCMPTWKALWDKFLNRNSCFHWMLNCSMLKTLLLQEKGTERNRFLHDENTNWSYCRTHACTHTLTTSKMWGKTTVSNLGEHLENYLLPLIKRCKHHKISIHNYEKVICSLQKQQLTTLRAFPSPSYKMALYVRWAQ